MTAVLEFQNVAKRYSGQQGKDVTAVDGVTFTLEAGECCCLLGPNGAGKTTCINMLLGFLPITSGEIFVGGIPVRTDAVGARKLISYIPDEVALYENLTGNQNLKFFASLLDLHPSPADLARLGSRVGLLEQALGRKVRTYSKGMRQRLAVAVSLLKEAKLYVFDEPTNGLDALGVREFMEILGDLRKNGRTIVVTTHDLLHVHGYATRVLFLHGGRIRQSLSGNEFASVNLEDMYVDIIRSGLDPPVPTS